MNSNANLFSEPLMMSDVSSFKFLLESTLHISQNDDLVLSMNWEEHREQQKSLFSMIAREKKVIEDFKMYVITGDESLLDMPSYVVMTDENTKLMLKKYIEFDEVLNKLQEAEFVITNIRRTQDKANADFNAYMTAGMALV